MSVTAPERIDLPVSGMTCAACARAIERKLGKTPGVERASVNFATSTATVEYRAGQAQVGDFIGAIEDLGYGVPETQTPPDSAEPAYRTRLLVAILCAVPAAFVAAASTRTSCRSSTCINAGTSVCRSFRRPADAFTIRIARCT